MRLILFIVILGIASCNQPIEKNSYWEKQKKYFKYQNKTEFIINSELQTDLKTFKKVFLPLKPWIDSVYLYSWQDRDPNKNEFTVIGNEGMYGPSLYYVIFTKKDSLITSFQLAGADDGGDIWTNFGSVFLSKDSFYLIDANTRTTLRGSTINAIDKNGQISTIVTVIPDSTSVNN